MRLAALRSSTLPRVDAIRGSFGRRLGFTSDQSAEATERDGSRIFDVRRKCRAEDYVLVCCGHIILVCVNFGFCPFCQTKCAYSIESVPLASEKAMRLLWM